MFYQVEKLTKGQQSLYIFSDYHKITAAGHKINYTQRKELIAAAAKLGAFTIVEDEIGIADQVSLFNSPAHIRPTRALSLRELLSNNKIGSHTPLLMLTHWLQQADLPHQNIEFRYQNFRPLNITFQLLDTLKEKIKGYNDDPTLTDHYHTELAFLDTIEQSCKELFDVFRSSSLTIQQYAYQSLTPLYRPEYDSAAQQLCSDEPWDLAKWTERDKIGLIFTRYCARWLDLEILHAITQSTNKNIFVCIGGLHTWNIREALYATGFVPEATQGTKLGFDKVANTYIDPMPLHINSAIKKLNPLETRAPFSLKRLWTSYLLWCSTY